MNIFPEPVGFLWDKGNIDKNLKKHDVTTQEAEELFASEPFVSRHNLRHGLGEEARYQALGKTRIGRKLFVAFTIRDGYIRVISVRDMTINEEQAYERIEKDA
jgi:uncharacterized protein